MGERITQRTLTQASLCLYLDGFADTIMLPRGPIVSVSRIDYVDSDGAVQTLSSSVYEVLASEGIVELAADQIWPATRGDDRRAVRVYYLAGYANQESVDPDVAAAVRITAAHLYERRGDITPDDAFLNRIWGNLWSGAIYETS
jgi:uncharacterized phiE125 gp8 family phage protein